MKTLPRLGKPTRHGYRRSKGYVEQDGQLVQKTFWLGHDPLTAVERIRIIDSVTAQVAGPSQRLVWSAEHLAAIERQFAAIDATKTAAAAIAVSLPTQGPYAVVVRSIA